MTIMAEPSTNGYTEDRGYVKLYLPDGHLYRGKNEAIGGGEELWKHTGLPYGTLNWKDGDVGTTVSESGKGQMLVVPRKDLERLGYTPGNVNYLLIIKGRPEDIPKFVRRYGMGISGQDHISDKMKFDIFGRSRQWFEDQMRERGIHPVENLEYRPVRLGVLALQEYELKSLADIREKPPVNGEKLIIASEFPYLAGLVATEKIGLREGSFEVLTTTGQTESYAVSKDVDVILEVVESGKSTAANGLSVISFVLDSTPYFISNRGTYETFPEFTDELQRRLREGKESMRAGKMGYLFDDRLDPDIEELDPHSHEGNTTSSGLLCRLFRFSPSQQQVHVTSEKQAV